jgi:heparinase II/III-like protein
VTRLSGMSLDELRVRAVQALRMRAERFSSGAPGARATQSTLTGSPAFPLGAAGDPILIARAVATLDPEVRAVFSRLSEAAEQGLVTLLGYGALRVGNPPRWHREALSGIEAPRRHWSRIDHLDTSLVGDHKLLWELNRHQYLLAPAFCWLLDRDARRFELVQSHLESWLEDNPPGQGVNWVSSLEVAYRAIAWCWLLWMLREAPWRPEVRARLLGSLEAHARHVEHFLSTYYSPNTHLTGEALGLFYVGTMLPEAPRARRWRATGAAILEAEVTRQVYPDGVYFEQTSQYQRYTAEIYLHYLLLADASGFAVADGVRDTLGRLFGVVRSLISAAGDMPLIGDDDGGLLLPLDHRAPGDIRALLLAGAVALQRADLAPPAAPPAFAYWLCGIERTDRVRAAPVCKPAWLDRYFAPGGLAVLRDGWDAGAAVAVIDAGPHGALSCGHSHADALAMTLSVGATELFIDRGTLTYTGPERDEFRATASHNTLEIDAASSVTPGKAFGWLPGIPPRAHGIVCASAHFSSFVGIAMGHMAGKHPSAHCRRVLHQRGGAWVLHDHAVRAGARAGVLRWQLAPTLTAAVLTEHSVVIRDGTGVVATIFLRGAAPVRVVTREVSPRLGGRAAAPCLELPVGVELDALTIVVPAGRGGAVVDFATAEAQQSISWTDAAGRHQLLTRVGQTRQLPASTELNADLIWQVERRDASDGNEVLIAALPKVAWTVKDGVQAVAQVLEQSGRMTVLANIRGQWEQLDVAEPRCG